MSQEKKAIFSEINITPLTDIFLVLLIIMMVVAPSFQSVEKNINIPEINSGSPVEQKDAVVSITADGKYYLNGNETNPGFLYSDLEKIKPNLDKKYVVVKADASVKSSLIMEVMRAAEAAGYEKLTIAGEPLNKKDSKVLEQNNVQAPGNTIPAQEDVQENENSQTQPMGALPGDY